MDDPGARDDEVARLRREVALARFYLDRFADPGSFVWESPGKTPHQFAQEALKEMDAERNRVDAFDDAEQGRFPAGTARMARLAGGRAGFVEFHQMLARQALDVGEVGAARAALRVLRTSDFSDEVQVAEVLFAVLRDSRSSDQEIADAALRLSLLVPTPSKTRSE